MAHPKTLLPVLILLSCASLFAQEKADRPWYLGATFNKGNGGNYCEEPSGLGLKAAYAFRPAFGIEVGMIKTGDFESVCSNTKGETSLSITNVMLYGRAQKQHLFVAGKLGLANVHSSWWTQGHLGNRNSGSTSSTEVALGLSTGYQFDQLELNLGWSYYGRGGLYDDTQPFIEAGVGIHF